MANITNATEVAANIGWDHPNIPFAFVVSIGAGLATGIGGALVFFPELLKKVPQATVLAMSLALSAGVMIYVSFIEIFYKSLDAISETGSFSEGGAAALTTVCFFSGMLFCALLEFVVHKVMQQPDKDEGAAQCVCPAHADVPFHAAAQQSSTLASAEADDAPEQPATVSVEIVDDAVKPGRAGTDAPATAPPRKLAEGELIGNPAESASLSRMGMMTALAIAIHNFPEGLATFLATVEDEKLGASLGVAIAVHNIPEGLCVAMPIYYATGSKWKAFGWSLLSGVTEPIGGILGFAALQPVFTPMMFGIVFAMVGGMMVFIVCHELLPSAHKYMRNGPAVTMCLMIGMIVMATSLVLFVL